MPLNEALNEVHPGVLEPHRKEDYHLNAFLSDSEMRESDSNGLDNESGGRNFICDEELSTALPWLQRTNEAMQVRVCVYIVYTICCAYTNNIYQHTYQTPLITHIYHPPPHTLI